MTTSHRSTTGGDATPRLDPALRYGEPEALLRAEDLTREEKIALLRQWAHDATQQAVAAEEGMGDERDPALLRRVIAALDWLSEGGAAPPATPAKH